MMKALLKWRSLLLKSTVTCLLIVTLMIALQAVYHSVSAQSISPQSLNNFNADLVRLRTRVNRLESQLRNNNRIPLPNNTVRNQTITRPPIVDGKAIGPSDPLLERLSTLLIELKEDVNRIDQRLTVLENRVTGNNN